MFLRNSRHFGEGKGLTPTIRWMLLSFELPEHQAFPIPCFGLSSIYIEYRIVCFPQRTFIVHFIEVGCVIYVCRGTFVVTYRQIYYPSSTWLVLCAANPSVCWIPSQRTGNVDRVVMVIEHDRNVGTLVQIKGNAMFHISNLWKKFWPKYISCKSGYKTQQPYYCVRWWQGNQVRYDVRHAEN